MRRSLILLMTGLPVLIYPWLYGGADGVTTRAWMPWVCGLSLLSTFALAGWRRIMSDSFFWMLAVFALYLVLPVFNLALCPSCDFDLLAEGASPGPRYVFLPFCYRASEQISIALLYLSPFVAMLGMRHVYHRAERRVFYEAIIWNAVLLALLGFTQMLSGAKAPYWGGALGVHYFATFGYPNMAGTYFTVTYAMSLGLWCYRLEYLEGLTFDQEIEMVQKAGFSIRSARRRAHYPAVPAVILFLATLATLSRAAITLVFLLTLAFFLYMLIRPVLGTSHVMSARRTQSVLPVFVMLFAVLCAVFVYAPPEIAKELKTVDLFSVAERVTGKGQYHNRVATAIMRDHPVYGIGGWGYRHASPSYLAEDELKGLQRTGGANVHNDYLQILAENGIVGFVLLVALLWLLLRPMASAWHDLVVEAVSGERTGSGISAFSTYVVSAPVLWTMLGVAALLVHAFGDCPLRSGANFALLVSALPASFGFLPHHVSSCGNTRS